jgi:hypothetical protein
MREIAVPLGKKASQTVASAAFAAATVRMSSIGRVGRRLMAALVPLVVFAALLIGVPGAARADANALTDDKSVSVPTGWWIWANAGEQFLNDKVAQNNARITDIEISDAAAGRFTATMVRNTGAYSVPGWWWYYGLSFDDVRQKINQHGGRLIDIETYVVNGAVRYAIVLVSNTGGAARTWWWWSGVSSSFIAARLNEAPDKRIVDLESYVVSGTKYYSVVMIANSGADAKAWQWWLNQSAASVGQRVNAFGGRITSLERQPDGTYNVVMVRNSGSDAKYWRYYYGLTSAAQALNVALQFNARIFDVETYLVNGARRYDVVMIDNVGSETRRLTGIFENPLIGGNGLPTADYGFSLKSIGGGVRHSLQQNLRWEPASAIKAVHNYEVMRRVRNAVNGETLGSSFDYYNYPNSPYNANTKDACPVPGDEVAANKVTTTLDAGKDAMMSISDNRTTRGIVLRYGLPAIKNAAALANMTNTTIDQDQMGCGWLGGKHNYTTLVDMGKLYEGVENGGLLGTGADRTEFFQPMNNGVSAGLQAVVQQEANALGKGAVAGDFVSRIRNHFKGGSYNIPCSQPDTSCDNGSIYIRANAGRMALPIKTGAATYGERTFVYGWFIGDKYLCDGCSSAAFDNALSTMSSELFRAQVRSALLTW